MTKLSITEETIELLPSRETLFTFNIGNNWAGVVASNSSVAANVLTLGGLAASSAEQTIVVIQG